MKTRILKPYHVISERGRRYVLNIRDMRAGALDERTADLLTQRNLDADRRFDHSTEEKLRELGLIPDENSGTKAEPSPKRPKEPIPPVNMSLLLVQA